MSLATVSSLVSAPPGRPPYVSCYTCEPSCSSVALVSPRRRRNASRLRIQPIAPCPTLYPDGGRGKLIRFAKAASSSPEEMRFPFLSGSAQKLLIEVAETLDKELGPQLHDSQTPSDVRYFKSSQGNAEGSVTLRAGKDPKVDFTLESWLHAVLPFGALDIGTIVIQLGAVSDAPHFLFEFILSGPVLVVVLDHLPRKDLVLDSAYLKRFYEDTELDKVRQGFEKAPDAKPYVSPVLFVRSVVSPTAAVFKFIDNPEVEGGRLDEQIASVVRPGVTQALQIWLDSFQTRGLPVENTHEMLKRDSEIKEKGVEVDLSSNLPRLFGEEITSSIVKAFRAGQ